MVYCSLKNDFSWTVIRPPFQVKDTLKVQKGVRLRVPLQEQEKETYL